jgi:hypothetical protein
VFIGQGVVVLRGVEQGHSLTDRIADLTHYTYPPLAFQLLHQIYEFSELEFKSN